MVIDLQWTGGFIVGIHHTDSAVVETEEDVYQFCPAIMIHLGLFTISFLFI